MKVIVTLFAAMTLAVSSIGIANSSGKTTYRDASGRTTGSSSTNSSGKTTYKDASGRTTGTSSKR